MRVDDVQGKDYRALLISTVRTCTIVFLMRLRIFLSNAKVQSYVMKTQELYVV